VTQLLFMSASDAGAAAHLRERPPKKRSCGSAHTGFVYSAVKNRRYWAVLAAALLANGAQLGRKR